ncbi:acetyl-CoA carboxylase biotin carboxyl carrier protein [Natronosporangium hydrolyticum]|uniref:Biotin carboxyl carrier protein of acetyl-CoA carboxylase n=1 Tax=Natronosporangium hydrolyticum TaxID=2811111 RepID=A0A895YJX8_9ACTN|nr:acetyl-CoA carboxylase biotin carboxyl carrier protein [Natronosporangium hydrolyticum]QSB16342.1 acetyl-CoA carboxylase biotin carboxyl carrier protein [Natronosporangium hydrolyticum]
MTPQHFEAPPVAVGAGPGAGPGAGTSGDGSHESVLAAVCAAAGTLLAQAGGPMARLRVRCGEVSVELRWPAEPVAGGSMPAAVTSTMLSEELTSVDELATAEQLAVTYLRAPMVGTFYHAPEPDAAPLVRVGDVVEAGQQIGILEAMKLMNPIEAEQAGRVVEVLVPNAAPVEYDQRLIAITTADPAT